jgi:hypothetical protein
VVGNGPLFPGGPAFPRGLSPGAAAVVAGERARGPSGVLAYPFSQWGTVVGHECGGQFHLLPPSRVDALATLVILALGIDEYQARLVKEGRVHRPLASTGNVAAEGHEETHVWLMRALEQNTDRFRYGIDPGKESPISLVDAVEMTRRQEQLYLLGRRRGRKGKPCRARRLLAYTPRPQLGNMHTHVQVNLDELKAWAEGELAESKEQKVAIERRAFDRQFGLIVHVELPLYGLLPGDQILSLGGKPLLGASPAEVKALLGAKKPWFPDKMVHVRVCRPGEAARMEQEAYARAAAAAGHWAPPPMAPGPPPPPPPREEAALCLSAGMVKQALQTKKLNQVAVANGWSKWADKTFEARLAASLAPGAPPDEALKTQLTVRRNLLAGAAVKAKLAEGAADPAAPMAHVWDALALSTSMWPGVAEVHFHPARLAAEDERWRCRKRLADKTLHAVKTFVGDAGVHRPGTPYKIIYLGAWYKQAKNGDFALQRFVAELAKHAVVVEANEMRTTLLCGHCGSVAEHPRTGGGAKGRGRNRAFKGTVVCRNRFCASKGRLWGRDTQSAANITNRFFVDFLIGGELGKVSAFYFIGTAWFVPPLFC